MVEPLQQCGHGPGDPGDVPAGLGGWAGEPEPRERGGDHGEGVGRLPAVGPRVREPTDDLVELDDRAGPAVECQQGHGVGLGRAGMDEVDPLAIDGGGELGCRLSLASHARQS
jgi:hypothetical protein